MAGRGAAEIAQAASPAGYTRIVTDRQESASALMVTDVRQRNMRRAPPPRTVMEAHGWPGGERRRSRRLQEQQIDRIVITPPVR